ncbi:hypothetical protein Y032_0145g2471 [Ancylostoma ceylanicum]|uniref:Uncharacterized protein n=1 Tax=Ancylostoma ceylanicum TaxID=53326 RepID=A0A016T2T2_9BILA|nr:hypothetical protein Y032_0145g2471 [Ancylostoma ceylanicum]
MFGRVWYRGKRLAAHAHGRWFDRACGQPSYPSPRVRQIGTRGVWEDEALTWFIGCPPASHSTGHIRIQRLYDAQIKSNA